MKHLVTLAEWSRTEVGDVLQLAARIKSDPGSWRTALAGKVLAMIFQKPSTRTRVSFEVGMLQLGGHGLYLSSNDLQLGRGETVPDTAKVLSRYVDGIMARVYAQEDIVGLTEGTVPVINGLSDLLHPCQSLADLQTMQERFGGLEGRTMAYVGDGNNVAHSLANGAAKTGMKLRIGTPAGYECDTAILDAARAAGGDILVTNDPVEAVSGVDAIYTDTWVSMHHEGSDHIAAFEGFQVDATLFGRAAPHAIFLHCLPAHRGEEVTDDVMDHERSAVLDQAENRLHAQKALLVTLLG